MSKRMAALAAAAMWVAAQAYAQSYPSKPIRIVAPFSPGASTDIVGRLLAVKLSESWGQPAVVENRAGAGGVIGASYVAKSPPDGYTLLMASVGSMGTIALRKNAPYDPLKDFAPITLGVRAASVFSVHPSLPVTSVKQLISIARARPGQLNYSTSGVGSPSHLATELFNTMAGVKTVHVPYKGPVEAMTDLLTGRVEMSITSVVSTLPLYRGGRLRVLASTGRTRMTELPDIPTMIESGLPGYEVYVWYGVMAPAGTPKDIVTKLNHELVRIFNLPDVKAKLLANGGELATGTPEEFHDFVRRDVERWTKVIRDAKIEQI